MVLPRPAVIWSWLCKCYRGGHWEVGVGLYHFSRQHVYLHRLKKKSSSMEFLWGSSRFEILPPLH